MGTDDSIPELVQHFAGSEGIEWSVPTIRVIEAFRSSVVRSNLR